MRNEIHLTIKVVGIVYILCAVTVVFAIVSETAFAQVVRERAAAVKERRLQRLERLNHDMESLIPDFKKEMDMVFFKYQERLRVATVGIKDMISDAKDELCGMGAEAFCPVVAVQEEVSTGHTVKVKIGNVVASMYNNHRDQTDDSPCSAGGRDICEAFNEGKNPIALSRELYPYPLNFGDSVKLISLSKSEECMSYDGRIMTVMDSLSECLRKNLDATGKCTKPIRNQIDIFYPCEGTEGTPDYCIQAKAHAGVFGMSCRFDVTKL